MSLTCLLCLNEIEQSFRKDIVICRTCFEFQAASEKAFFSKQTFLPADRIFKNIFVGPARSALNAEWLRQNNIDRILIAAEFCDFLLNPSEFDHLKLNIDDSPQENIRQYFEAAFDFIRKNPNTNVLIHCMSGISRSGTLAIAYIMLEQRVSYETALATARAARPCIHPNSGFQKQLLEFEKEMNPSPL